MIDAFKQSVRAGWSAANLLASWRVLIGCTAYLGMSPFRRANLFIFLASLE